MGRKRIPGLIWRGGVWHVDKRIGGRRVCRSTETADLQEAERYLARVMEQTRQAQVYGVRPTRTFEQAAAKFVLENQHKRSIGDDVMHLKQLIPLLATTTIDRIHRGTLQPWIERRQREGKAVGTINHGLKVVRRILNLATSEWVDEHGMTWLPAAPKIKLLADTDKRQPHPLNWDEQTRLFRSGARSEPSPFELSCPQARGHPTVRDSTCRPRPTSPQRRRATAARGLAVPR